MVILLYWFIGFFGSIVLVLPFVVVRHIKSFINSAS